MTFRRLIKWLAVGIGGAALLLALLIGGVMIYHSIDRVDTFVVADAQLENPTFLGPLRPYERKDDPESHNVYAHRIAQGHGTVFGYRLYSNGLLGVIDDEIYRKVTLWIPFQASADQIDVQFGGNGDAILISSQGGSAWPKHDCSFLGSGTAHVERKGDALSIRITGSLTPAGRTVFPKECAPEPLDLLFEAEEIKYGDLTPWLGRPGEHPYDETYRQIGA